MGRRPTSSRAQSRHLALSAIVCVAAATLFLLFSGPASASQGQISIIQDDDALKTETPRTVAEFRELGATTIRYLVFWREIAPDSGARRPPKHFDAANPSAYPAGNWSTLDTIVATAKAEGMTVDLDLTGPPPRWAQGRGVPHQALQQGFGWRPNARDYGEFVHAVAKRYDGKTVVDGHRLPRVSFWSLWNEPNFGQDLGPQAVGATHRSNGNLVAPKYYRNLLRFGWRALHQTGHGNNTILVGEIAAKGRSYHKSRKEPQGLPGNYGQTLALQFVRALYCVNGTYHRLNGTPAGRLGCPTTQAASQRFRRRNPALFDATGFSDHPYSSTERPAAHHIANQQYVTFPVIDRLVRSLGRALRAYHASRDLPIYSTEFGYITSPPQKSGHHYPSPFRAAVYLNQAEYLSYKNPRVRSYAQYLLDDPSILPGVGLFSSGLLTAAGRPKPAFDAYRLPLWVPHRSLIRHHRTEVWGAVRPAHFGAAAARHAQQVRIQLQRGGHGPWTTLDTVRVNRRNGYFDVHPELPAGGKLRLRYTYPSSEQLLPVGVAGSTIVSRSVKVTVH
jgi:hypothetical protein